MKQRILLEQSFSFLKDWGFEEIALNAYQGEFDDEKNCIINLRSNEYCKQVELVSSGFESISCLIRNIIQNEPAPYFDLPNNITHQELALLYEGRSFDHKKYYGYNRATTKLQ